MSIASFWGSYARGREFGYRMSGYLIVPGRHIGHDNPAVGDIPSLTSGRVNQVVDTPLMGRCVEIDTRRSRKRYLTYCHLAKASPARGAEIAFGGWVGRVAKGPATLPRSHVEFPGTSWGGQHVHLVESDIPGAAWTYPPTRKLTDFYDPTDTIRAALATTAGGGYTPFPEEDEMSQEDINQIKSDLTKILNIFNDGTIGAHDGIIRARNASEEVNRRVSELAGAVTKIDNAIQDPKIGILGSAVSARDNAKAANQKLDQLGDALSKGGGGAVTLTALPAEDLVKIAKAVNDEIDRRQRTRLGNG
ncbi:hypothetical protein ACFVR6_03620 [Microbacterium sp. NPDC058021]|uniref:hypothetical protein n=1 Tax=Microbacterium sp. NPDC058021 TaxID=3346306 RepID=UPI0036D7744F